MPISKRIQHRIKKTQKIKGGSGRPSKPPNVFNKKNRLQKAVNEYCENSVDAIQKYGDIDTWDVSNITDMSGLFKGKQNFNRSINNWNVSNVTNMKEMFSGASAFNQPLDSWNVSNVTDMEKMFFHAESFNQPLNPWIVSNVTNMKEMFFWAENFNQPLNSWNVSNVTNMSAMFYGASAFNQPLGHTDNEPGWNVSKVTNMNSMFGRAFTFNQPLDSWIVSKNTNMDSMFDNARAFNEHTNEELAFDYLFSIQGVNDKNIRSMFGMGDNYDRGENIRDMQTQKTVESNMLSILKHKINPREGNILGSVEEHVFEFLKPNEKYMKKYMKNKINSDKKLLSSQPSTSDTINLDNITLDAITPNKTSPKKNTQKRKK